MSDAKVTVVIPVGPYVCYKRWLRECLESVRAQTYPVDEILMIDDMAGIALEDIGEFADEIYQPIGHEDRTVLMRHGIPIGAIWLTPWRLGDAGAFNCGVGLARNELVFLLSCDDTMEPECLELCVAEWEKHECRDAFYWVGAHIIGCEGETVAPDQAAPFGNAMVTKELWRISGGYLPGAAISDWLYLQMLGSNFSDRCYSVASAKPLYSARSHSESITSRQQRGDISPRFPAEWGRTS